MKKKIVFVICNGRSGSTVFSKFLGAHSQCFALSEPLYFDTHFNNTELCSCEKSYLDCGFWNSVVDDIGLNRKNVHEFNTSKVSLIKKNDSKLTKLFKYAGLFLFVKFRLPFLSKAYILQLENEIKLLDSVTKLRRERVFIDASKNLVRAVLLKTLLKDKYDYSFIYLERKSESVIQSMTKDKVTVELSSGASREFESNSQMSAIDATKQIKAIARHNNFMRKIFCIDSTFVSYDDFVTSPSATYMKLNLGFSWEESMLDLDNGEHHLLGGNYSRINAKRVNKV